MNRQPKRFRVHGGLFLCAGLAAVLTALLACNFVTKKLPQSGSSGAGTLVIYAAQTLDVRRTATAAALQSVTATPLPAASQGDNLPVISAQEDTNCRKGPNIIYERVGYLLVGKQSTVHGRNQEETWWYIANPVKPGEYCWVWGETTTVSGDLVSLPVVAPPAALEISFEAAFVGLKRCYNERYILFQVHNTGDETFFSASITIHAIKSHQVVFSHILSKPFLSSENDCPPGRKTLYPGDSTSLAIEKSNPSLGYEIPFDKDLRATIVLCTEADPTKTCVQQKVEFKLKR